MAILDKKLENPQKTTKNDGMAYNINHFTIAAAAMA
jgi:hypothetical protein